MQNHQAGGPRLCSKALGRLAGRTAGRQPARRGWRLVFRQVKGHGGVSRLVVGDLGQEGVEGVRTRELWEEQEVIFYKQLSSVEGGDIEEQLALITSSPLWVHWTALVLCLLVWMWTGTKIYAGSFTFNRSFDLNGF